MKIKEVENLLSVSRSNIRFYEKEGLLSPEREKNNYRDYSEQDVITLKKILALRKLGFTVEEISSMQKGELSLTDAIYENISRLEKEITSLQGALEITKALSAEKLPLKRWIMSVCGTRLRNLSITVRNSLIFARTILF